MSGRSLAAEIVSTFEAFAGMGNVALITAWANHLHTSPGSPEFFQGIAQVASNLDRLKAEVEAATLSDKSRALYLDAVAIFRQFVSIGALANNTTAHIANQTESFNLLHLLEDVLPSLDVRVINPITLEAVKSDLEELAASLEDAEIDARLKAFLRRQIADLLWAVTNFDVIGLDGLSRVYGAVLSEVHRAAGMKGADAPAARSWLGKARAFGKKMGAGVIFASAVLGAADGAIEHGSHLIDFISGAEAAATAPAPHVPDGNPSRPKPKKD
jgi:hypothetical protein